MNEIEIDEATKKYSPIFNDQVIVKRDIVAKITPGGIHIPDKAHAEEEAFTGTVVGWGPGFLMDDGSYQALRDLEIGMKVRWSFRGGSEDLGEGFWAVRYTNLVAGINE